MIKLERSAEEEREKLAGLDGAERSAQWRALVEGIGSCSGSHH
ncbi:hypothetical protein AB0D27_35710 [Streptomyces sp. NPDC048415]